MMIYESKSLLVWNLLLLLLYIVFIKHCVYILPSLLSGQSTIKAVFLYLTVFYQKPGPIDPVLSCESACTLFSLSCAHLQWLRVGQ